MAKIQMTAIDVISFMVMGLKNGNYQAALKLGEEFLKIYYEEKEDQKNGNEQQ